MKVAKNMDSVFANCTEDELDFDVFFPDDDTIIDCVAGCDEAGVPLTGPDLDFSFLDENGDPIIDEDDADEREGKINHNTPAEGSKDTKLEIGGEVGDGKEVSGKENSAESHAHDVTKKIEDAIGEATNAILNETPDRDTMQKVIDSEVEKALAAERAKRPLAKIKSKLTTTNADGKTTLKKGAKIAAGVTGAAAAAAGIVAAKKIHDKKKAEKEEGNEVNESRQYDEYADVIEAVIGYYMSDEELMEENFVDVALATADYMIENADYLEVPDASEPIEESVEYVNESDSAKKDRKYFVNKMERVLRSYFATNGISDCIIIQKNNKEFFKGETNTITFVIGSRSDRRNITMGVLFGLGMTYSNGQKSNTVDRTTEMVKEKKAEIIETLKKKMGDNSISNIHLDYSKNKVVIVVTINTSVIESTEVCEKCGKSPCECDSVKEGADPIADMDDADERKGKVSHSTSDIEAKKQEILGAANKGSVKGDPIADTDDADERAGKEKHNDNTIEGISSRIIGAALEAVDGDIDAILNGDTEDDSVEKMNREVVPDSVQTADSSNEIGPDITNYEASYSDLYKTAGEAAKKLLDSKSQPGLVKEDYESKEYQEVLEFVVNECMSDEELMDEDANEIAFNTADYLVKNAYEIFGEDVSNPPVISRPRTTNHNYNHNTVKGIADYIDADYVELPANDKQKVAGKIGKKGKIGIAAGVAAGTAAAIGAGIAAKKIHDKKKAEKENQEENGVKENYEYPEYQDLLEFVVNECMSDEELMYEYANEIAFNTADCLIENAYEYFDEDVSNPPAVVDNTGVRGSKMDTIKGVAANVADKLKGNKGKVIGGVAAGAAVGAGAAIAAKKIHDKKKAEKENQQEVKENYEYPGYQEILEFVVNECMNDDEIMDEDANEIAFNTADYLVENACLFDDIVNENKVGNFIIRQGSKVKEKGKDIRHNATKLSAKKRGSSIAKAGEKIEDIGTGVNDARKNIADSVGKIKDTVKNSTKNATQSVKDKAKLTSDKAKKDKEDFKARMTMTDLNGKKRLSPDGKKLAGKVTAGVAAAAAATAAGIAIKKHHDKKKAEKENQEENGVKENYEYPEYQDLLEQVAECLDESVIMSENAVEICIGVADSLIENAMNMIQESESNVVFTGWRDSTVTEASKAKIDDNLIADTDDDDIEDIASEKDIDSRLSYGYDDDELIDIVDKDDDLN